MNPIVGQIPYRMFRAWGWPVVMPLNYTISLTTRCNYRCATCRIYQSNLPEMAIEDYRKLFTSLGRSPYWVTFSGGEPFLRDDFEDIVDLCCGICRPKLVNIPTNGSMPDRTSVVVRDLANRHPKINFIINVSLDSVGEEQNSIRGNRDAWRNAVSTIKALKKDQPANLLIGIGTVISKNNLTGFEKQRSELAKLGADSMVAEVAEKRAELLNQDLDITPSPEEYEPIADHLIKEIDLSKKKGWAGIAQSFRRQYYGYVYRILQGKSGLPCYAGFASVQIMPDGAVWGCCIRGDGMGRLSDHGYNFKKLWHAPQARQTRKMIKARQCACPLANASYTNMVFDLPTSLKVIRDLIF
ncbi:MAG: radical SAM protein [Candidatus Edwardsbacteria bacterium]|nr:radical SAM protein [Candidatus Edwardsbacteria bacterium]MBU1576707.1 radical SAM protein [Candidatus Edwardsbacteria bacterium]MBU2463471.1 radical SAM protein [Candidatus Edwardsbacteria bacterium]MBU2594001.1 radical SAM protein [Candidatus Edwardsbacteria bacterium]